jgi:diguanylate cyclase (GGDEF)-like protein
MRLRFWIGLIAVFLVAAGSVAMAALVYQGDDSGFHKMQHDEAVRAARQTEAVAGLSIGQLASAAAFFEADRHFSAHQFRVVGRALRQQKVLTSAAFVERVPLDERARYEGEHGFEIVERAPDGHLRRAGRRPVYFPVTYVAAPRAGQRALGYDIGSDPERGPYFRRARDADRPVATPIQPLVLGGLGVVVGQPVYRDGAPTATVAERRRALVGFVAGSFRLSDLAATGIAAIPGSTQVQLRVSKKLVVGPQVELEDPASAQIHIADRTWLLVVRDPNRPEVIIPVLLAVVGIALALLLGALILLWRRDDRMAELQREASHDALTGLKNRRRFEEELRGAIARSRRDGTTGALLMIDLDHFKQVNDTFGHPAGDRLIEEIAGVLRRRTRDGDVLARLGGDEFAVVLPHCGRSEALVVGEAIAAAIRDHQPGHGTVAPVTASIGVALFGDDPRLSFASIVSEADAAMYMAKDSGRDGVRIFDRLAIRGNGAGAT